MGINCFRARLSLTPGIVETGAVSLPASRRKGIEGFLVYHEQPFRKTHALVPLGEKCVGLDPSLETIVSPALDLTRYAVEFRYPGVFEEPTVEEALKWLAVARTVLAVIVQRPPQEPLELEGPSHPLPEK
jgi:hypothetical protein